MSRFRLRTPSLVTYSTVLGIVRLVQFMHFTMLEISIAPLLSVRGGGLGQVLRHALDHGKYMYKGSSVILLVLVPKNLTIFTCLCPASSHVLGNQIRQGNYRLQCVKKKLQTPVVAGRANRRRWVFVGVSRDIGPSCDVLHNCACS
jgi:hypothetical protein